MAVAVAEDCCQHTPLGKVKLETIFDSPCPGSIGGVLQVMALFDRNHFSGHAEQQQTGEG